MSKDNPGCDATCPNYCDDDTFVELLEERDKLRAELDEAKENVANTRLEMEWPVVQENQRLREEIEALTHTGRQGELEQFNVGLAEENQKLREALEAERDHQCQRKRSTYFITGVKKTLCESCERINVALNGKD